MKYINNEELIQIAKNAKEFSYSPYSKFRVGAALLCDDGSVFTGCNVENASYGLTNCAERTAIFKAVSEGKRNFKKLILVSDSKTFTFPCGACRQVISEFAPNLEIVIARIDGECIVTYLKDLLPNQFNL